MKKLGLKVLSAALALLPSSQYVLASIEDRGVELRASKNQVPEFRSGITAYALSPEARGAIEDQLAVFQSEIDRTTLQNSVFTLDDEGRIHVIGTKSDLKQLIELQNSKAKELNVSAGIQPTCA